MVEHPVGCRIRGPGSQERAALRHPRQLPGDHVSGGPRQVCQVLHRVVGEHLRRKRGGVASLDMPCE